MTDSIMEKSQLEGNRVDTGSIEKPLSLIWRIVMKMVTWIVIPVLYTTKLMCVVAVIIGVSYVAVELLTPDPWYVQILPW